MKDFQNNKYLGPVIDFYNRLYSNPYFSYWLVFLALVLVAFFLRLWGLGEFPIFIYRDESWNGVEGLLTLKNGDFRPFYEGSTGREGMLIWLIAVAHTFFEPSAFAVRLAPALIGFITVIALPFCTYSLLRYFQGKSASTAIKEEEKCFFLIVALAAMFFLATSYWHVNFSRITFRAILDPFFSMLSCTLVALSYQYVRHYWLHVLAGGVCALGLYGYGAFKFTVIPLTCIFFYSVFYLRAKTIVPTVIIAIAATIVAFPLVKYIFLHSDNYFLRLNQVSIFRKSDPLAEFFNGLFKLLGMLGGVGDSNLRHNTNSNAQLNILNFTFYLMGIFALIRLWFFNKQKKPHEWAVAKLGGFAFIWFIVMLVPSALTYDAQPHALRAIGIIVPIMLISAIGVACLLHAMGLTTANSEIVQKNRGMIVFGCFLLLAATTYSTATEYFYRYQKYPGTKHWFDYKANEAAFEIKRNNTQKYLILVQDRHSPQTRSVIQNMRYLTNLKMDNILHNNIIRLRDLKNHPLRDTAIIYTPRDIESSVIKIVGNRNRVKLY